MAIQTPPGWIADQLRHARHELGAATNEEYWQRASGTASEPMIRRIDLADLWEVLRLGARDLGNSRTDVVFICVFYPLVGLVLGRLAFGYGLMHLLFPLTAGFALIGPFAAVGLMEMSRLREEREHVGWADAFGVLRSPSVGAILVVGLYLSGLFGLWLYMADLIHRVTLGLDYPRFVIPFLRQVLTTPEGWTMVVVATGVGFLFALAVLVTTTVAFPLLLDRKTSAANAIILSVRASFANPGPVAAWGLIVAVGLFVGSVPLLLGLVVVMPLLGHASWHLYRELIAWPDPTMRTPASP